jgi:hypothetical protein
MLSLIKAHCFRIKGDWYLVYPLTWRDDAWFLPAADLTRYIRLEILRASFSLLLTYVYLSLANDVKGNTGALLFLLWCICFFVSMFMTPWYLEYIGGRRSNFDGSLLVERGMTLAGITYKITLQFMVFAWLFLLSVPLVVAWRMPYVWEHSGVNGVVEMVLAVGLALAAVWWIPRAMLRYAGGVSLADIDPPAQ